MKGKTILYGNGLNLLARGAPKWDNLLTQIDSTWHTSTNLQCIASPNTIQYDQLELISSMPSLQLIKNLCDAICGPWNNQVYEHLSSIPNVNYITTNYDLTLEEYFNARLVRKERKYNICSYYTHMEDIQSKNKELYNFGNIWHIHGDIRRPKSIILGYDHYCKQITKIREYIPTYYSKIRNHGQLTSTDRKWKGESWIDLFFNDNVYILGLGLGFAELDLWWILDLWARCKKAKSVFNKIIYLDAICGSKSSCKSAHPTNLGGSFCF